MLLSEFVELKWNPKNKKRYIDLGYQFTKIGDTFIADVNDLSDGSNATVDIECDYCHKVYKKKWYHYLVENKKSIIHKDSCNACKHLKAKESVENTYGVKNVFCLDSVKEKIAKTNIEKYNSENPFGSEIIQKKISKTIYDKYGVYNIRQSDEINQKIAKTNLKRYGCECSLGNKEVRQKMSKTIKERYGVDLIGKLNKGRFVKENSPLWKGGAEWHKQIRNTDEYRKWRYQVFKRDNYICQCCGNDIVRDEDGAFILNAHHIFNFADNEKLRFDIDNGVTLCKKCHREFHNIYGYNNTTRTQYDEFIEIHGKKVC